MCVCDTKCNASEHNVDVSNAAHLCVCAYVCMFVCVYVCVCVSIYILKFGQRQGKSFGKTM